MHPDWARSLRDHCLAVGVPYFFKPWGALCPGGG
jgi:protein gp37